MPDTFFCAKENPYSLLHHITQFSSLYMSSRYSMHLHSLPVFLPRSQIIHFDSNRNELWFFNYKWKQRVWTSEGKCHTMLTNEFCNILCSLLIRWHCPFPGFNKRLNVCRFDFIQYVCKCVCCHGNIWCSISFKANRTKILFLLISLSFLYHKMFILVVKCHSSTNCLFEFKKSICIFKCSLV